MSPFRVGFVESVADDESGAVPHPAHAVCAARPPGSINRTIQLRSGPAPIATAGFVAIFQRLAIDDIGESGAGGA